MIDQLAAMVCTINQLQSPHKPEARSVMAGYPAWHAATCSLPPGRACAKKEKIIFRQLPESEHDELVALVREAFWNHYSRRPRGKYPRLS